jgi:hypothetical protein
MPVRLSGITTRAPVDGYDKVTDFLKYKRLRKLIPLANEDIRQKTHCLAGLGSA